MFYYTLKGCEECQLIQHPNNDIHFLQWTACNHAQAIAVQYISYYYNPAFQHERAFGKLHTVSCIWMHFPGAVEHNGYSSHLSLR